MIFGRFHHGHSAALGFLLALSLARHMLVFALLVFLAGLVAGRMWLAWVDLAMAVKAKLLGAAKREPIHTTPQPVYSLRRRAKPRPDEEIPY